MSTPVERPKLTQIGALSLALKLGESALSIIVVILLAQMLGSKGYGVYAFALALVSLVSIPTRLGLPSLVMRETAKGQAAAKWSYLHGLWRWSTWVTITLSLIVAVGGSVIMFSRPGESGQLTSSLLVGFLLVPLLSLAALRAGVLRGLRHVNTSNLVGLICQPALLVILLVMALCFRGGIKSPFSAMVLTVLAALGAFLIGSWLLRRKQPAETLAADPEYKPRFWLASAWPMALTQGAHQFNRYTDVLLLGLLSSLVDAGVYRIAAQGAILVSLGMTALGLVTAPNFARLHSKKQRNEMQNLIRRSTQAGFVFAVLVTAGFGLAGQPALAWVFGDEFRGAWLPLLILSAGHVVSAAIGPSGMLLNMTGYERAVTRAVAVAAVVNIFLNILLIPVFGAVGAASATAFSLVLWKSWLWFTARQRLGIRCSIL